MKTYKLKSSQSESTDPSMLEAVHAMIVAYETLLDVKDQTPRGSSKRGEIIVKLHGLSTAIEKVAAYTKVKIEILAGETTRFFNSGSPLPTNPIPH